LPTLQVSVTNNPNADMFQANLEHSTLQAMQKGLLLDYGQTKRPNKQSGTLQLWLQKLSLKNIE
jgi:hypothetical protein